MSYETLFQAETLQAQRDAAFTRAAHVAELRAARRASASDTGRVRGWAVRHLPAVSLRPRHRRPAPERARLAG
ncbi:hypothetical protein ACFT5B_05690 [Luteimicrobium sp. NPDC057192]|uniref:hypothetical protein n=1 Tax=Luteimicrobium sp. NPDC057192 TaxID=3346042 RepID=UPI0036250BCE